MHRFIGDIIQKHRRGTGMTQDEYGNRHGVSGPAIFKFEKGYVRPSLELWMRIAADAGLSPPWAVRIWLKDSLPEKYKEYVELQGAPGQDQPRATDPAALERADYTRCTSRETMISVARADRSLTPALREFIEDPELWALYKPRGSEINLLHDIFSPLGTGSKDLYREALYALRLFANS